MSSWSTVKNECSKMLQLYWTLRMIAIECRNRSMWFPTTRSTPIAITWSALRISQRSSIPSWKLTTFQCAWTRAKLYNSFEQRCEIELSQELKIWIYNRYQLDFELFGYTNGSAGWTRWTSGASVAKNDQEDCMVTKKRFPSWWGIPQK